MLCYLGLYRDPRNLKSLAHWERAGLSPADGVNYKGKGQKHCLLWEY